MHVEDFFRFLGPISYIGPQMMLLAKVLDFHYQTKLTLFLLKTK